MGDKWDLCALKELSIDNFWTWAKKDGIAYDGYAYLGIDKYVNFEKYLWFELGCACGGITEASTRTT